MKQQYKFDSHRNRNLQGQRIEVLPRAFEAYTTCPVPGSLNDRYTLILASPILDPPRRPLQLWLDTASYVRPSQRNLCRNSTWYLLGGRTTLYHSLRYTSSLRVEVAC